MYVPLSHAPGHAQCDFGQAKAVIGGVERTVHYFVLDLPHSDGCFVKAYPAETTEAFLRRSRLGVLVARGWAAEHRLRQHEACRGEDHGGRAVQAYAGVLGAGGTRHKYEMPPLSGHVPQLVPHECWDVLTPIEAT